MVVGAIVMPSSAWEYWTSTIFDSSRVGSVLYLSNQSINGALTRIVGKGGLETALWAAGSIAVVVFGLWTATRLWRRGLEVQAVVATALISLMVSPISWAHHWVWVMVFPAALLLWPRALEPVWVRLWRYAIVAVTVAMFVPRLLEILPGGNNVELRYTGFEEVIAAGYPLIAVAVLAYYAVALPGRDVGGATDGVFDGSTDEVEQVRSS